MHKHIKNLVKSATTTVIHKSKSIIVASFSDRYLLFTNLVVGSTMSAMGDFIEQNRKYFLEEDKSKTKPYDTTRTRNLAIYGMACATFCHYWYNFLDRKLPDTNINTITKKILLDQVVCSPVCIIMLFVTTAILEHESKENMLKEMKQKGGKLYATEWAIWPAAQFINFYFLPTRFRVLYDNVICLAVDTLYSYMKYDAEE